jgi:DNA-binding NtrC family response regulator
MSATILILDDELDMLFLLKTIIAGRTPHQVVTTNNPLELEELMARHKPALIISDLKMLGRDGLEVIDVAHRIDPGTPVVIITAYASVESAEEAIRRGAYDYITKPFRKEQVLITIARALEWQRLASENRELRSRLASDGGGQGAVNGDTAGAAASGLKP